MPPPSSFAVDQVAFDLNVYALGDQKISERFAGQQVKVTGSVHENTKTLKVG